MSALEKRSVVLRGHATSVALEPEFWDAVDALAVARGLSLAALMVAVDDMREEGSLASALRVAALEWARG
ncbi:ribbon-helix-helix domain-containing protein [Acuticoccus sp. MNP-M23]|uniref:ribbon-helix-helix domain-containing protein n=1 Tax=Acuticoccus sp. MNP-M23 TaxID=3072793 RepID=UPI0028165B78|nr:ribbon-helix-helix domain-containing protein [Acuticoccus sp. MNP-M23]WMS42669.1 ribbon-helix-helix domain-containing protein [Acuticoccus sp. MNP-M23]